MPRAFWERLARTPEEAEETLRREAAATLGRQLDACPPPSPPAAEVRTRLGRPASEIVEEAREGSADLAVLGAHGRNFLRDLLLGTTAESVIRSAVCPVLIVKRKPAHLYRRILVPVDFSDTSRKALALAERIAQGAKLLVMHAYEIWYEGRLSVGGTTTEQLLSLHREYEAAFSQKLRAFVGDAGIDPDSVAFAVRHGYPGSAVTRVAADLRADLVALGTRGMSSLGHLFLGSVAEHALREAHCDVLAVCP